MGGVVPIREKSTPEEEELSQELVTRKREQQQREKQLADIRLTLLRRRQARLGGLATTPDQQQTIG